MLVSVIIPTLNEVQSIEQTIQAARLDYDPDEVEMIVVDGGSSDGTIKKIPSECRILPSKPGRAIQMNLGASHAKGDIFLFCHADTKLPPKWRESVIKAVTDPDVMGGAFLPKFVPAKGILHILNSLYYPPNWRLMYGDQALFVRGKIFESIGGFPELPIMEDIELMRRLAKLGKLVRIPQRVETSSRRFITRGPLRQTWLNIKYIFSYIYLGTPAEKIADRYYVTDRDKNTEACE